MTTFDPQAAGGPQEPSASQEPPEGPSPAEAPPGGPGASLEDRVTRLEGAVFGGGAETQHAATE